MRSLILSLVLGVLFVGMSWSQDPSFKLQRAAQEEWVTASEHYKGLSQADFSAPAVTSSFLNEGRASGYYYQDNGNSTDLAFGAITPYFKFNVARRDYNDVYYTFPVTPDDSIRGLLNASKLEAMNLGTGVRLGDWFALNQWDLGLGVEYRQLKRTSKVTDSVDFDQKQLLPSVELHLGRFDIVHQMPVSDGETSTVLRYNGSDEWQNAIGLRKVSDSPSTHFFFSTHKKLYQMISFKGQIVGVYEKVDGKTEVIDQIWTLGSSIRFRPMDENVKGTFLGKMFNNVPHWLYDWEVGVDIVNYTKQGLVNQRFHVGRWF